MGQNSIQFVPAQPGYFLVREVTDNNGVKKLVAIEPVIAWSFVWLLDEGEPSLVLSDAIGLNSEPSYGVMVPGGRVFISECCDFASLAEAQADYEGSTYQLLDN